MTTAQLQPFTVAAWESGPADGAGRPDRRRRRGPAPGGPPERPSGGGCAQHHALCHLADQTLPRLRARQGPLGVLA